MRLILELDALAQSVGFSSTRACRTTVASQNQSLADLHADFEFCIDGVSISIDAKSSYLCSNESFGWIGLGRLFVSLVAGVLSLASQFFHAG